MFLTSIKSLPSKPFGYFLFNTVITVISPIVIVMLYKPTCLCCCRVYPHAACPVVYCLLVCWVVARTRITGLFRWPAALLLVCRVGVRFVYTCSPNSSSCYFFCMALLIAMCFPWFHTEHCLYVQFFESEVMRARTEPVIFIQVCFPFFFFV
jgi:hypothetical protein